SHSSVSIEVSGEGFANLVWQQDNGSDSDIYAQRINANLNTLWSTPEEGGIIVCDAANNQTAPKVNDVSDTISAIVWEDNRAVVDRSDIYIQYVDADGNMLLDDNGEPLCTAVDSQVNPRVKADENSTYVVWSDHREGTDWWDIYAQRHTLTGGNMWEANGKPIALQGKHKANPRLTVDDFGGVFIVWEDERVYSTPEVEVYIQHLTPDGTESFATDGLVLCDAENIQEAPLVRPDGFGNAIVVWGDRRTGSYSLYVQHVDPASGVSFEANGREMYFGIDGNGVSPKTLYLGNDRTFLYWTDYRLGGSNPITFGQIIDENYDQVMEINGIPLGTVNDYQTNPKAVLVGENVFLNYVTVNDEGTFLQNYQIFDSNLTQIGPDGGTPVYEAPWQFDQLYGKPVAGDDGYVYMAFSDFRVFDYEVFVQKYDENGNPQWGDGGELMADLPGTDDIIRSIEALPGGGCVTVWQGGEWFDQQVFIQAIDGNGDIVDGWDEDGVALVTVEENQTGPRSAAANNGTFVAWKDSRNGNADIYGQYILYDGTIQGLTDGFPISAKINDQQKPTVSYDSITDEVIICWEDYENGVDFDIFCKTINLGTLEISEEIPISTTLDSNETNPFVFTSLDGTHMIIWEDTRNTTTTDIYYQEIHLGELVFEQGGIYVCNIDFKQELPGIDLYSETNNSYVMYWDDSRSSGKEDLINIYVQSRTITGSACGSMDVNLDGDVDILDIVTTVGIVLETIIPTDEQLCAADANLDGDIDILDIVTIVNFILNNGN
ncbi:MAG: hypothetical protein H8D46_00255, partial [FCB group bacterium]|nr:hypothetical protein [FCB group bacterium]